ncbi:MAG: energy-coupling factor transporter ATPase [Defluviitaleaceae bacterium]|nr:energy-coupling factor transporter ATPase [Defluviitaleaceae bacterium]
MKMLHSKGLTFKYEDYEPSVKTENVLDGLDISIEKGEFVAILGHNGSGKSTLARHMNALLSPTDGTLWVNGMDTKNAENTWEIRQTVGMVFQNPDNQMVAAIVEEDVAFGLENLGVPPQEIRERVNATLKSVGMSEYAAAAPHQLSGGQKQRVAIAGVLAMQPSCIVLDEPSAMLDPCGRREVMETITRLNRESGITIILITHFMEEAARANRIIVMDSGKIVMDAPPREVFSHVEKMHELGLGVPQVTALAFALRKRGMAFTETPLSVSEFIRALPPITTIASAAPPERPRREAQPIIELRGVSHIYNAHSVFEKAALSDVNLQISKGEMVAIIGHTGSGKSTLIQHFNGLLAPTAGTVLLDGENISDKAKLKKARQRVGLVFQYPEHQLFEVTVYKDVAFGPGNMGLSQEEVDKNTRAALEIVGLSEDVYDKSPFEISGGQKRRAAIAGVLAMRPDILVLDEPAAGLDPRGKQEIFAQIKKMHEQTGITVILISHSMDDAAELAERVIVMNKGRIVRQGTPEEIFTQGEFLQEIGLDTPQISRLMSRLNAENPEVPARVFTVEAAVGVLGG